MDSKRKPEVVTEHTCLLGESPVWNASNKKILWVDILQCEIHQYSILYNKHIVFRLDQMVGAIALNESEGIIAALQNGFAKINIETGAVEMIHNPEAHIINNRFNDGKCDPAGRFWAGSMPVSGNDYSGNLYVLDKDLSVSVKIKEVGCSNGLSWSPDNKTFYYIDTPTLQVAAYDYDITNASISNRRVVIEIPEVEGFPDGMTIDSEGMLWIAIWNGWKVMRWNPYNGQLLDSISLPVSKITSCTFGGDTMEDLYITSAKTGLSEKELKQQPLAGSLFVIKKCGYKGLNAFRFGQEIKKN